jgi:hypothetical protein
MLEAARVELCEPREQQPSYRQLLNYGVAVWQQAYNQANNTGRSWAVTETILTAVPGSESVQVNGNSIGRIISVTTYDPTNPAWIERPVTFHDLGELTMDWLQPQNVGWWPSTIDGSPANAVRIAFFRLNGLPQVYARILPMPQIAAQYRCYYQVGAWADSAALAQAPLFEQYHQMLICQIARDALPATRWSNDVKADLVMRKELRESLQSRINEYLPEFKLYIASLTTPRRTMRNMLTIDY